LLDYITITAIEAAQLFSTIEETMSIGEFLHGVCRVARLRHLSYQTEERDRIRGMSYCGDS
jgi:hypothetical protein